MLDACDEGGAGVECFRVWCVVLGNACEDLGFGAFEEVADEGRLMTLEVPLPAEADMSRFRVVARTAYERQRCGRPGLSGFVASVEFRHHRPCGAVGVGQHDGIDVSVAVPGEQGTDAGVAAFLVER